MVTPARVVLGLGQTATAGECGSCRFFHYRDGENLSYIKNEEIVIEASKGGYCAIVLPPQYAIVPQGESAPTNNVNDNNGCDLWRSSGKEYVVSKVVKS